MILTLAPSAAMAEETGTENQTESLAEEVAESEQGETEESDVLAEQGNVEESDILDAQSETEMSSEETQAAEDSELTVLGNTVSGKCGPYATWTLDTSTGALTISGTSYTYDYYNNASAMPWYSYRSKIKSVTIGTGIRTLGSWAFYGCTSLTSVTFEGLSLQTISIGAFYGCTSLKSITLPDYLWTIDDEAFSGCTSLKSISLQDQIQTIGENAFYNTAYYNNSNNWTDNVLYIGNYLIRANDSISGAYAVKSKTRLIAEKAFYNCTKLKSVTTPASLVAINPEAFWGCTGLKSAQLEDDANLLSAGIFYGCTSLTSVNIPTTTYYISDNMFHGCTSLEEITIPDGVNTIGNTVFSGCTSLKSITIPSSVKNIYSGAFWGCSSMKSVTFEKNSQLTTIGDSAFRNCSRLTSIEIPDGVTSVSSNVFFNCTKLKSVTIPDSVTNLGGASFFSCTSLTDVKLGNGIKKLQNSLFSECSSLESITIPDSVTTIGGSVFYECTSLKSIKIPSKVTKIESQAFISCSSLKTVYIPRSVTFISSYAFEYCTSLKNVYFCGTKSQWKAVTLGGNNYNLTNANFNYHKWNDGEVTKEATCEPGTKTYTCSICKRTKTEEIAADHKWVDTVVAPTYATKGYTLHKCSVCGEKCKDTYVSKLEVAKPVIKSVVSAKKKLTVNWGKESYSGYEVQAATNSKFTEGLKSKSIKSYATTSKVISGLKANTDYYVRVRAYKTYNGKEYYSDWTTVSVATSNTVRKCTCSNGRLDHEWITSKKTTKCNAKGYYDTVGATHGTIMGSLCHSCKEVFYNANDIKEHFSETGHGGNQTYYVDTVISLAHKEWIATSDAWSKTVITYKCACCGKTKTKTKLTLSAPSIENITASTAELFIEYSKKLYTGYQVQVALNSKFTKGKITQTVVDNWLPTANFSDLKSGKKYYVRVRAYKRYKGKNYYSAWSKVKTAKAQ